MTRNRFFAATVALVALGASVAAQQSAGTGPEGLPPESYAGNQFIDAAGCAYVRASVEGEVAWMPRLAADGQALCGFKPTFEVETAEDADAEDADAEAMGGSVTGPESGSGTMATTGAATATQAEPDAGAGPQEGTEAAAGSGEAAVAGPDAGMTTDAAGVGEDAVTPPSTPALPGAVAAEQPAAPRLAPTQPAEMSPFAAADPAAVPSAADAEVLGDAPAQDAVPPSPVAPATSPPRALAQQPDLPVPPSPDAQGIPDLATAAPRPPAPAAMQAADGEGNGATVAAAARPAPSRSVRTAKAPQRRQAAEAAALRQACEGRSGIQAGLIDRRTGRSLDCGGGGAPTIPEDARRLTMEQICADIRATGRRYVLTDGSPVTCGGEAEAQAAAAVAGDSRGPDAHRYVQVGAFAQAENARRSAERLAALGLPVRQATVRKGGTALRVVAAGPFADDATLASALRRARAGGFADAFTRR